jgi:hypothetical protein
VHKEERRVSGDGDEGWIQRANVALEALIDGDAFNPPKGGPGAKASPNMALNHAVLGYVGRDSGQRDRLLAILRSQADPQPGKREGIGVVEEGFEQSPLDHHVSYHITPTCAATIVAHKRGDTGMRELGLRVLGRWYASWKRGEVLYGRVTQVALPGSRGWPFKAKPLPAGADGLNHGRVPFAALNACYRLLAGYPQIDNKGKERTVAWIAARRGVGLGAVRGLVRLEQDEATRVPRDLPVALCVPLECSERQMDEGRVRRLWLTKTATEIAPWIQGFVPGVQVTFPPSGEPDIAWAPERLPEGWTS